MLQFILKLTKTINFDKSNLFGNKIYWLIKEFLLHALLDSIWGISLNKFN